MRKVLRKTTKPLLFLGLVFISLFMLLSAYFMPTISVSAESIDSGTLEEQAEEELEENIREQINKLDLDALQEYVDSLGNYTDEDVGERLLAYIKGTEFDYLGFAEGLLRVFLSKVLDVLPAFACIAAISLLSGLLSMIKSGTNASTSSEMMFLITYAASLIPLISILIECFSSCQAGLSSMSRQMQIIFPIMLTLLSASGSSVSASVCRPAVGFFSTTIVGIIENVVLPLTILIIAFSMAGNLTKTLKIEKFTAFFKAINKWVMGVCISVFGLFFTLQGITSATYDGVVRRAAKYAIGNGIPIVGGFLSGGFDIAVAGSILIKNSLGSMGIFLMVSVLFEPLILLISVNLMLKLVSAITQPFGDSRISDFLGETATNLQYCTAALLFVAFLYFLSIVMMIFCTEALF